MENELGKFLQQKRTDQRWSVRDLAARSGVSKSALSDWETGKKLPRLPELEAALTALRASATQRRHALSLLDAPRAVRLLRQETAWSPIETRIGRAPVGGDLLRAMRLRRNVTLQELAAHISVQASSISRWERGESWPTMEHLHALCYALEAREEELLALSNQKFTLTPRSEAETMEDLFGDINRLVFYNYTSEQEALKDLRFLTLIERLWAYASRHPAARVWLPTVYARYAQYLYNGGRLREAQPYVERAFDLRKGERSPHWFWLCAGNVAAGIAVRISRRPRPDEGVNILRGWLDYLETAPEARPNDYAWALSDMAEYLVMQGATDEAVKRARQAYALTDVVGSARHDIGCRQLDLAQVLLKADRPGEALDALSDMNGNDAGDMPGLTMAAALVEAEVLLALGRRSAVQSCLSRSYDLLAAHGLHHGRDHADAIAQQMNLS